MGSVAAAERSLTRRGVEAAERRQVLGGAPTPLLAHSNRSRHRAQAKHAIWYH